MSTSTQVSALGKRTLAAALIAAAAGVAAAAPPADATELNRRCAPNGFRFVPNASQANARIVRTTRDMPGLVLYAGRINGVQHGWASYDIARYRDRVWMDWSTNGGRNRVQCGNEQGRIAGPRGAPQFMQLASPGKPTSRDPSYVFRACGQTYYSPADSYSRVYCTAWW